MSRYANRVTTLQTLCIFAGGYLLSRLLLRVAAHFVLVGWLADKSGGSVSRIVLGVMVASFALSTFVPNALTVLALVPVLRVLADPPGKRPKQLSTALTMALVYGSNLGGVASLIGSPANLYLLVNLRIFSVAKAPSLNAVSWLVFGLPMATCLLFGYWLLMRLLLPRPMRGRVEADYGMRAHHSQLRIALSLAVAWLVAWLAICAVALVASGPPLWRLSIASRAIEVTLADAIGVGLTVFLAGFLFGFPMRQVGGTRASLLAARDLVRDLPLRGLLLGGAVLGLLAIVASSGLIPWMRATLPAYLPTQLGPFATIAGFVLVTIFATELLNNTTVATMLFPLAFALAGPSGIDPLILALGVSLASTCAFMSPLATPVNALAFGSLKGVSITAFLRIGAWANLVGGLWIAAWLRWLVPPILGWFR